MLPTALSNELINKYNDLRTKQKKLLVKKATLEDSLCDIEKQIQDCFAAGRLFDVDLNTLENLPENQNSKDKPTIRDFIIDALKRSYPQPYKAKELQDAYEQAYGDELHPKTVGMSLYRLSLDKLVKREGQKWFYSQYPTNTQIFGGSCDELA